MNSIKSFINWVLGMLATVALVICLYAGFLMVTSAGDEAKYKKGMDILKRAGIGLIIIGLAWLIVSVVFWLIGNMTK
ncbi:MAG: pilin [Candidatus Peribacteria bacterium]|nr:pilin [Candidatus Peribacteria bacterium]